MLRQLIDNKENKITTKIKMNKLCTDRGTAGQEAHFFYGGIWVGLNLNPASLI